MKLAPSLLKLWVLANAEAWYCQASNIEPVHFWLAALKLANPDLAAELFKAGGTPEDCKELAELANGILGYLEMDAEKAKQLRAETRVKLLNGRAPRGTPDGTMPYLHRSESSRRLFEVALEGAAKRNVDELTVTDIIGTLFDMNLVTMG